MGTEMNLVAPRVNAELHAFHPQGHSQSGFTLCNRRIRMSWIDGIYAPAPTCKQCRALLAKIKG